MEESVQNAIREMADMGPGQTHAESCWQWHLPCAALRCADLLDDAESSLEELRYAMKEQRESRDW